MNDQLNGFHQFVQHKLSLAKRLGEGECGGEYSDAAVIIAAVISGVAADLWPGTGIDHARFVETWVRFADPHLRPSLISVPLLARRLTRKGKLQEAELVKALRPTAFGGANSSKVLTGDDVDVTETVVLNACQALSLGDIRDRSYPSVFYAHVRSALVHENHFDNRSSGVPMTDKVADVSYVNRLVGGETTAGQPLVQRRLIHFHLPWLLSVAESIAKNAASELLARPIVKPATWWLKGGAGTQGS